MAKVGEKSIIEHQLDFVEQMVPDALVHVVIGYKWEEVREHLLRRNVHTILNPFWDCSGINGSAWLSLPYIKSQDVWRIDGDVIFTEPITLVSNRTVFFANNCPNPRETAYLNIAGGDVTSLGLVDDYKGPHEWSCSEIYRHGDYRTVVSGGPHLVKMGHYFEAVNHAIDIGWLKWPGYRLVTGVYEIDTREDLDNARKQLSDG